MNKAFRILFFFLTIPFFLFAGGNIRGKITDATTGKALEGAHIALSGTLLGCYSVNDGSFYLPGIKAGHYTLRVSFIGYKLQANQVDIPEGETVQWNVSLIPAALETGIVEIRESKQDKRIMNTPMRMELIPSSLIRENSGQSIVNVLDNLSGVNLSSTTGIYDNNAVISMRGLSGNDQGRTLVLMDGFPINKTDEGSVNWHLLNRDNIEEIEVIKGPGPAKYGSNAMGGVINIISRKPGKKFSGNATLNYGTFNTMGFRYSLGGRIKPLVPRGFYYNLDGFYTRSDGYNPEIPEYLEKADSFYVNTFLRETGIGAKAGYQFSEKNAIEVDAGFFNDKRGRGIEIYEVDGAFEKHDTYRLQLQYNGHKQNLSWNLAGFLMNEHFQRLNESMSEGEYNLYLVRSLRSDLGAMAGLEYSAGSRQVISAGLDFRQGTVDGQDIYYTSTDLIRNSGKMMTYAAYVQDEIRLSGEKLILNGGLRLNYAIFSKGSFSIEKPSFEIHYLQDFQDTLIPAHHWLDLDPKLSLQYRFSPETRIYFSLAKGFRAPILDDLCRTGKIRGGFKISNPALGPENLYNMEAGMDTRVFGMVRVSPSVYYSVGNDFMYFVNTGDSVNLGYKRDAILQKRNISRVDIAGAEIDLDAALLPKLTIFANYSFSVSKIAAFTRVDSAGGDDLMGKSLTDVPEHKASAGVSWRNDLVSTSILWKYTGRRWINNLNEPDPVLCISRYPDYSTFSLRCWHTFLHHITLAFTIDNIFNKIFIDYKLQQSPGRLFAIEVSGKF